jgi:hypothetical protein
MRKVLGLLGAGVLFVGAFSAYAKAMPNGNASEASGAQSTCDYACLTGMVNQYLKALVAHDPGELPLAPNVRFTENTIPLKVGEALWGTISSVGDYRVYFADPQAGEAGIEATISENGSPAILLLRLRVVDGKITEIETLVHRNADDAKALEAFGHPNAVWTTPVNSTDRTPRQVMVKDANIYFDGILHSNGNMVPFDLRCNRILDGYQDTNHPGVKGWFHKGSFEPDAMNIRDNMNTGIWSYIHSIEPRRVVVVDQKMGIVVGMFMFNHPGNVKYAHVKGVGEVPMPPIVRHPSSVLMGEFFKIENGKIRQIEGISVAFPYGAGEGWEAPRSVQRGN